MAGCGVGGLLRNDRTVTTFDAWMVVSVTWFGPGGVAPGFNREQGERGQIAFLLPLSLSQREHPWELGRRNVH